MKTILRDHGRILHWMGGHHLFPVRGPGEHDLGFAAHGATGGRQAIGWNLFFEVLDETGRVVVVDGEAGEATVLSETEARAAGASTS